MSESPVCSSSPGALWTSTEPSQPPPAPRTPLPIRSAHWAPHAVSIAPWSPNRASMIGPSRAEPSPQRCPGSRAKSIHLGCRAFRHQQQWRHRSPRWPARPPHTRTTDDRYHHGTGCKLVQGLAGPKEGIVEGDGAQAAGADEIAHLTVDVGDRQMVEVSENDGLTGEVLLGHAEDVVLGDHRRIRQRPRPQWPSRVA